jgi:hypothetical protein
VPLVALALAAGCGGAGDDADPRPAAVPASAELVDEDVTLGSPSSEGVDPAQVRALYHISCNGELLAVVTTREAAFAELPCDRALPREIADTYLGLPVELRIQPADPAKLRIRSATAGSVEFTVGRVWMEGLAE